MTGAKKLQESMERTKGREDLFSSGRCGTEKKPPSCAARWKKREGLTIRTGPSQTKFAMVEGEKGKKRNPVEKKKRGSEDQIWFL